MPKFDYDYYSGDQTEQFRFLKIPKIFFEDPDYEKLGLAEMILYGFLHEQVSLSRQNGWIDEDGRVYVLRTIQSMQKLLKNCSPDKARSALKNLIDFGLVEKKRRGQGKPDLLYVKNFVSKKSEKSLSENPDECGKLFSESEKTTFLNAEKTDSGNRNFRALESGNPAPKEHDDNNIKYTEPLSIYHTGQDYSRPIRGTMADGSTDGDRKREISRRSYAELIRENINYEYHMTHLDEFQARRFDDFYNLILEVVLGETKEYVINKTVFPQAVVKSRFLKLTDEDILNAISQISNVADTVRNMHGYMISMLYNSPTTRAMQEDNNFWHSYHNTDWAEERRKREENDRQESNNEQKYDWDLLEKKLCGDVV